MSVEETTEDRKKRFRQMAQGALSLNVAFVGVANGLYPAFREAGSLDAEGLSVRTGMDRDYLVRWMDAAYAFGYLEESSSGRFRLTADGEAMCPDAEDTLMPVAVGSVLSAHMAERAAACMRTGERPGEVVLGERKTILPWFGSMIEANFAPLFRNRFCQNSRYSARWTNDPGRLSILDAGMAGIFFCWQRDFPV